jgi:hypothetical protein
MLSQTPNGEWAWRWRVARGAFLAAAGWILALPVLARLMRWHRQTVTWVQNIVGTISGLVWGRIGWVGVRRYGFSPKDAFLAGGLAGLVTPTFEFLLRSLGWPPGPRTEKETVAEPPSLAAYPFAWFWGFLLGGAVAVLGAIAARKGKD